MVADQPPKGGECPTESTGTPPLRNPPQALRNVKDKETTIRLLQQNRIACPEIIEPTPDTLFPILGRAYGHHQGEDIRVIEDYESSREQPSDYYMQWVNVNEEYRIVVIGLEVVDAFKVLPKRILSMEYPVRTPAYGWSYEHMTASDEMNTLAVRSTYALGLCWGQVDLALNHEGKLLVLDVNAGKTLPDDWIARYPAAVQRLAFDQLPSPLPTDFTLGCDVEFMLRQTPAMRLLPASFFWPMEGPIGCDDRSLENANKIFPLAEIRPEPSTDPDAIITSIERIMRTANQACPYRNVQWLAGSMPFAGYQVGGHIHFGITPTLEMIRVLDNYLCLPLLFVEHRQRGRRRHRTRHGQLGAFRIAPHGFQYLSAPSWIIDPATARAVLHWAKIIVKNYRLCPSRPLASPLLQEAFYKAKTDLLHDEVKGILDEIARLDDFADRKDVLLPLFQQILAHTPWDDSSDLRTAWGIAIPDKFYTTPALAFLSGPLRTWLGVSRGEALSIRAGAAVAQAQVEPAADPESAFVQLSPETAQLLQLPALENQNYSLLRDGVHAIRIGPFLGILGPRAQHGELFFGRQTKIYRRIIRMARSKGICAFVFNVDSIVPGKRTVRGYVSTGSENEQWIPHDFPMPDVIYDRMFADEYAEVYRANAMRERLQYHYKIPFINPPSLFKISGDKMLSHNVLQRHPEIAPHLPDTQPLLDAGQVLEMVFRHGVIFIKPASGYRGRGVIKLQYEPDNKIIARGRQLEERTAWKEVLNPTEKELGAFLREIPHSNKAIIQQGILPLLYRDRPVETRFYFVKNSRGLWLRSGLVARVAPDNVYPMNANVEWDLLASRVLKEAMGAERREVYKERADALCRKVLATLEKEVGPCGELAIDIIPNRADFPYIVEVNAKPDSLLHMTKAFRRRNLSILRMLGYAKRLAGFGEE
ncbi:hypothetical protein GTO89_05560 [Heliobacterium gestii]|uniref:ATP-grasp domain-containing protein n=1 Tax=Heliomicrobium gestii TaxID=2699 RepID=A0A845L739_HELGE|nr:YheC/YheD family protein [Heliomicrobium gestii]MBM7866166.1 glutathione synthase/RimK-type ligase-like ATP-grasp enzyme [Heliomicrobium gestii]MZP42507.1 hypothetical protein [Heliomicrobium gestii]